MNLTTTIFELDGLKVNSNLEFDKEIFNKLYSQGMSAGNDAFGFQLAKQCSEFAALFVAEKSCTLKEASNLLGKVLFSLNDTHLAYGLDVYKKKLEETGDINLTHYKKLTAEANMDIFAGMMELEKDNSFNKNILVNVLTMPDDKVFRDKLLREVRITRPRETKSTNESLNPRIEKKQDDSIAFEIDGLKVNYDLEFDKSMFDKLYAGGVSASSHDFGYQFTKKCAELAADLINNRASSLSLQSASTLLANAIFSLNDNHIAYGLDVFKKTLEKNNNPRLVSYGKLKPDSQLDILVGMTTSNEHINYTLKKETVLDIFVPKSESKKTLERKITKNEPLNARIETKDDGSVFIYNDKNQLHAQGIPAVTLADGTQQWFLEGIETTQDLNKKQVINNIATLRNPPVSTNRYTKN